MGADCWQMNGSGFTALDYARDMETAQFLCPPLHSTRWEKSTLAAISMVNSPKKFKGFNQPELWI